MCGIAGASALDAGTRPDPAVVLRMTQQLRHRGPDGEGLWCSGDGRTVFGHRRLSVIDLAGGTQPMVSADGLYAITFNGEIYNYRELREELERSGVRFRTQSDTEVLLQLFQLEGERCLERCDGMFALALWDGRQRRLLLARDRLGKKPLFLAEHAGILYFSSTLGALRLAVPAARSVNLEALDDFLSLGFVPAPRSIIDGIEKLPAGSLALVADGRRATRAYWTPAPRTMRQPADDAGGIDALDSLLQDAVRLRLRSDVPLGVFLSGGVDSSLITAYAARVQAGLETFTIRFGESGYDESVHAEEVSRALGTVHRTIQTRVELLDLLPELVRQAGEPFADASALPLWVLAGEARASITVALGGDGGDEAFGGYPWYRTHEWLEHRGRFIPPLVAEVGAALLQPLDEATSGALTGLGRARRTLQVLALPSAARRYAALRVEVGDGDVRSWYGPSLQAVRADRRTAADRIASIYGQADHDRLTRMRVADLAVHLADGLMPKSDIATMAHGLELRSPLLDHRVVEFGLSLPSAVVMDEAGGKSPLRRLLERHLPRRLTARPKQGFVVPFAKWFRGPLRSRVEGLSSSALLAQPGWFDPRGIDAMVSSHLLSRRDHTQRLFNLVVLEEWLRQQ